MNVEKIEDAIQMLNTYAKEDSLHQKGYVYIGRVECCRSGGCDTPKSDIALASEYFDYLIYFNTTLKVAAVKVYNYQATHGQEVTAKSWLKQFIGFDGTVNLEPGKDIDAISGATISVYAITADIEHKTRVLQKQNHSNK